MKLEMKYFVLKPKGTGIHAEASRAALHSYANVLRHYPRMPDDQKSDASEMAEQLDTWAQAEHVLAEASRKGS